MTKRVLWVMAALAMTVALASPANADNRGGRSKNNGRGGPMDRPGGARNDGKRFDLKHDDRRDGDRRDGVRRDYHLTHGSKFQHGFFFKGDHHRHWSSQYYHRTHGCTVYYCPSTRCEYYWCVPDRCYYPLTYCPYGRYSW